MPYVEVPTAGRSYALSVHDAQDVRGAVRTGHVRYILGISLAAAVAAMVLTALFA